MSDIFKESLEQHKKYRGKWEIKSKVPLENNQDLSLYYSPGVAEPCKEIQKNKEKAYDYTNKGNTLAIISDGTSVLGLGDIGPEAGLPVMEGKGIIYKRFVDIDFLPICIDTKDTEEIIKFCKLIAPSVGGIHLEDISAPRCVEIETRLKQELDIPVFHDDQHGTAIVVSAALINSAKLLGKNLSELKIVVAGAGAAGSSIIKNLYYLGIRRIRSLNSKGALHYNNPNSEEYDFLSKDLLDNFLDKSYDYKNGDIAELIEGADVFIGVSKENVLNGDLVKQMSKDAIIFALANPIPEIMPDIAKQFGARIVGTGRSDFPNQINNILAFPGLFKGALEAKAKTINQAMITAAIYAIAACVDEKDLHEDYVIPSPFDMSVSKKVSEAVKETAIKLNITRK